MAKTMLIDANLPHKYWAEAVNTACFIINRVYIRPILKKTPYELWKGRRPNIAYFHIFGCKCFILNNGKDDLGKFDYKSDEGIFLGYSSSSKAYRVYNKRTLTVEESIHVSFDETNTKPRKVILADDEVEGILDISKSPHKENQVSTSEIHQNIREHRNHPLDQVIGDVYDKIKTRRSLQNVCAHYAFLSYIEPKKIDEAIGDENWILAMQEELNQFKRNNVWTLMHKPENHSVIVLVPYN